MKKKIVMAIAVLGMAFAGQVIAQNDSKVSGGGSTEKLAGFNCILIVSPETGESLYTCVGRGSSCKPNIPDLCNSYNGN